MICHKFQRIISCYLNFSETSRKKKNSEGVTIYLVKLKVLSLQLHKCTHFWLFLRYLFLWLLRKHIKLRAMLTYGFHLLTSYMYKEFLIRIKDYPSWHLLVQNQQKKTRTDLRLFCCFESNHLDGFFELDVPCRKNHWTIAVN